MSDRESPEGGPPRKKLAPSHTPEVERSHDIPHETPLEPQPEHVHHSPADDYQIHDMDISSGSSGSSHERSAQKQNIERSLSLEFVVEPQPSTSRVGQEEELILSEEILEPELRESEEESPEKNVGHSHQASGGPVTPSQPGLPPHVIIYYNTNLNNIRGVDEVDLKTLYNHNPSYLLSRTIGSGSYGSVHSCLRHMPDNTDNVAVKILKENEGNTTAETIEFEGDIIDELLVHPHRNILQFFEEFLGHNAITDTLLLYIVSELSTVGDLHEALQVINGQGIPVWKPVKQNLARYLITGIARGVSHLKTLDISHADLKPENILLFENILRFPINEELDRTNPKKWIPKLTDFGNSQRREDWHPVGRILVNFPTCTLNYASPESYQRNPDQTFIVYDSYASDVFSVGVCLLCILIGAEVFIHNHTEYPNPADPDFEAKSAKYQKIVNRLKSHDSYIKHLCKQFPYELRQFLFKILDPNPEQRITIEELLTEPWITTYKPVESENVPGHQGIFPALKNIWGKDFAKEY